MRNVIVLGHIAASFIGGGVTSTGAKDVAIIAVESTTAVCARSAKKLAEEVHDVLLNTCQLRW